MVAELAKFRAEFSGGMKSEHVYARVATLISEALGSETSEDALMSSVETRLSAQLDGNLKSYLEAKIIVIQEELRGMLVNTAEVTASELRGVQAELTSVRRAASSSSIGQCPCVSGNCPCTCKRGDASA